MKSPVQLGNWIYFSDLTPGIDPPAGVEELELWDKQDNKRKVLQFGRPSPNRCLQWYSVEIVSGPIGDYPEAIELSKHISTGRYSHWRYAVSPYDLHQIHPCSDFTPRNYHTAWNFDTHSCLGDEW